MSALSDKRSICCYFVLENHLYNFVDGILQRPSYRILIKALQIITSNRGINRIIPTMILEVPSEFKVRKINANTFK